MPQLFADLFVFMMYSMYIVVPAGILLIISAAIYQKMPKRAPRPKQEKPKKEKKKKEKKKKRKKGGEEESAAELTESESAAEETAPEIQESAEAGPGEEGAVLTEAPGAELEEDTSSVFDTGDFEAETLDRPDLKADSAEGKEGSAP